MSRFVYVPSSALMRIAHEARSVSEYAERALALTQTESQRKPTQRTLVQLWLDEGPHSTRDVFAETKRARAALRTAARVIASKREQLWATLADNINTDEES